MFFHFTISSKDIQTLEKFINFLLKLQNLPIILKYFAKQKKKKFITILKSPHVNKTAQEQFEFRYYSRVFLVNSFKPFTFFLILKKIKNLSFPNVKLEVKGLFNIPSKNRVFLDVLDPDHLILKKYQLDSTQNLKTQRQYLQLFDCYGELCLKNSFYS